MLLGIFVDFFAYCFPANVAIVSHMY